MAGSGFSTVSDRSPVNSSLDLVGMAALLYELAQRSNLATVRLPCYNFAMVWYRSMVTVARVAAVISLGLRMCHIAGCGAFSIDQSFTTPAVGPLTAESAQDTTDFLSPRAGY
jgi:hypothetical protein